MIKRVTVDGRPGFGEFVDAQMQPIQEPAATFLKIVFDDGEQLILAAHPSPNAPKTEE